MGPKKRELMTEEEKKVARAKDKEKRERRKATETEEERQEKRKRRKATETEQEKQEKRARHRKAMALRRATESEEQKMERRAKAALKMQQKRAAESEQQKLEKRAIAAFRIAQKRAAESEQQKLEQRTVKAIAMARKRAEESEQQKLEKRAIAAFRMQQKRAAESEQQKLERRAIAAKRMGQFRAAAKRLDDGPSLPIMTPVQRIKALLSQVNARTLIKNPEKYEAARAFIKNSLLEIVSLHEELGQLKGQLQRTVAEAVGSAVKLQRSEKRGMAELHGSTFVEIPLSLATDKITTFENVSDPLLLQSEKEIHSETLCPSSEDVDPQNRNDKIFQQCFHVFSHGLASHEKSTTTTTMKKLTCWFCSKNFGTSLGLTIHQKEHKFVSNEFNCSVCSEVFPTYNLMTTHYLEAHSYEFSENESTEEIDDEFERSTHEMDFVFCRLCLICFESFEGAVSLTMFRNHIIDNHSENKELLKYFTYICCHCDQPYAMMHSLKAHWETICVEKWKNEGHRNSFVCEQCGIKLSNEKSLASHVKIFHTGKNVICDLCGSQLKNENILQNHMRVVHRESKFACEDCGKKFTTRYILKKHKEVVHLGVRPFVCKFCSKRLSSRSTLRGHEKKHTGERPYECKLCNKTFAAKSSLMNHEGIHKGFNCKTCGETFSNFTYYCVHRQQHHRGPNVSRENTCKICNKSFKNYILLNMHKQNFHENRKYPCNICGKLFNSSASRHDHKFSHDKSNRFGCNLCGKEFRHPTNFYKHRKVAHAKENAQIVNLTSKKILSPSAVKVRTSQQFSNLECEKKLEVTLKPEQNCDAEKKSSETLQAENEGHKESENISISKHNLELANSPELDDYFSEVFDNQDDEFEDATVQFEIAELRDASPDLANTVFTSQNENAPNSDDFNENKSNDLSTHQSLQSTETFIDFSRANVPLAVSESCEESNTHQPMKENSLENKKSENQLQVFMEDSAANFVLAEVNIDDLVKMKAEKLSEDVDDSSIDRIELQSTDSIDDDSNDENDCRENSKNINADGKQKLLEYTPRPVVKLTRLLEYNCVPCDKMIYGVSQREIRNHRRTHRSMISKKEKIVVPKKIRIYSSKKSDIEMKGTYDCLYCDTKGFVRCRELVFHCSKKHPRKKPLKCKMCPEMFICFKTLREHKSKVHDSKKCSSNNSDEKKSGNYNCLYCEEIRSVSCSELVDHCSEQHPGKEPLRCRICEEMLSSYKALRKHKLNVHNLNVHVLQKGKNEFVCELCGKNFSSRQRAQNHFLYTHQERKFKCDECSKLFPTIKELERHQLRHSSTKSHLCEECGKAYFTPHELTDHFERVHRKIYKRKRPEKTKEHPFSCSVCPYVCNKESALKAHSELHDPRRKFSCDECGLRYKFYTNVITHKNYRHKKKEKFEH